MTGEDSLSTVASGVNKLEEEEGGGTFGVWLPASILIKYRKLPRSRRRLIRNIIKSFISELVERAGNIQGTSVAVQNVMLNVNMPIAMVRLEDACDIELLKERIRELEYKESQLKKLLESYREKARRAEFLEAELKRARDELKTKEYYRRKAHNLEQIIKQLVKGQLTLEQAEKLISSS